MQSDWRSARLAELGRIVTGKTPPTAVEGCFGGSTLFVTPSDYDGTKYIRRTTRKLTARGEQAISSARLPPNAVMVTCIGSDMGKTALNATEAFTNQQINSLIVESGDLPEYVYYNLSMRKNELRARASGSAQPILNKSAFGATELELPTLGVQAAIVEALKALDDRIDLLRETNATLEAIAQTLFKSWFIDFDPVRAKAEGREPEGMDTATAALFPAAFEESHLGAIPKGWRIAPFSESIQISDGKTWSTQNRIGSSDVPVFGANGQVGFAAERLGSGRVIFLGKIGSCGAINSYNGEWWATNNTFFIAKSANPALEWCRYTLDQIDFKAYVGGSSNPYMPLRKV